MGRSDVLEGVVMLEVRRHAGVRLRRHRVFLDLSSAIVVVFIVVIVVSAFVLEVARALVFVWLAVLKEVNVSLGSVNLRVKGTHIIVSAQRLIYVA
jgi:hypothetical protein